LQPIQRQDSEEVEGEKGKGVVEPTLLLFGIDASNPIQGSFDRSQYGTKDCSFASKNTGHVPAERLGQPRDQSRENSNLRYAKPSHFAPSSSTGRIRERHARA